MVPDIQIRSSIIKLFYPWSSSPAPQYLCPFSVFSLLLHWSSYINQVAFLFFYFFLLSSIFLIQVMMMFYQLWSAHELFMNTHSSLVVVIGHHRCYWHTSILKYSHIMYKHGPKPYNSKVSGYFTMAPAILLP